VIIAGYNFSFPRSPRTVHRGNPKSSRLRLLYYNGWSIEVVYKLLSETAINSATTGSAREAIGATE
jgi:hypothetical protein